MSVKIKSYLPPEKRERSKLQQVKDKHRSFTQTNKDGISKDLNELKSIKYREHAITFLNQYTNIKKNMRSKSQYCKTNHISHNSLNTGLKLLGYKTRVKETNLDKMRRVETNLDQSRPVKTSKSKSKPSEIKCGKTYEDEEIDEMINNSLAN